MPIITGEITLDGAVVDALVGVSKNRARVLQRVGLPVPAKVPLRLQLDTGAALTGLLPSAFQNLDLTPLHRIFLRTPSTTPGQPHEALQYDISVILISGLDQTLFPSVLAISCADFSIEEGVQGIIGRDILNRCVLEYFGLHRSFRLSY